MCGIVGYIGSQPAAPLLVEGLQRLEYRGYDSAGVAVVADGALHVAKKAGKIANLTPCWRLGRCPATAWGSGTPAGPPTGARPT